MSKGIGRRENTTIAEDPMAVTRYNSPLAKWITFEQEVQVAFQQDYVDDYHHSVSTKLFSQILALGVESNN